MTKSILKVTLAGIAIGALAFFVPKLVVGFFVLALLMRLLFCRKRHGSCGSGHGMHRFYMADKIRSMSEAEYTEFKNKHSKGCCHHHTSHHPHTEGGQSTDENKSKTEIN
jgi:hypothetical protein